MKMIYEAEKDGTTIGDEKITSLAHGDFSCLAEKYSKFRPGYSKQVLRAMISQIGRPPSSLKFVDVGAGTGIWTRMVAELEFKNVMAIEPNPEMRRQGEKSNRKLNISWKQGSGEKTGLETSSCDFLTMASSFHWVDYESGVKEFSRVLKKGAWFGALWNTRYIEDCPILIEIEKHLKVLLPEIKRVSSGNSEFCDGLLKRLHETDPYDNAIYFEGLHFENMSPERYLGIWDSVNDIRVQMGQKKFEQFISFVKNKVSNLGNIKAFYRTRAWMAQNQKNEL